METPSRLSMPRESKHRFRARLMRRCTFTVSMLAALAFLGFYQPPAQVVHASFGAVEPPAFVPPASPSFTAFGRSGAVQVQFALPGGEIEYPLVVGGDPTALAYTWVRHADSVLVGTPRILRSDTLVAPTEPGIFRLSLERYGERRIVQGLTLAVLVPFELKRGATLDGYRIGIFPGEQGGSHFDEHPQGFVRVTEADSGLAITKHFRMADFLTRDGQTTWPRYAAINPQLLEKLELVLAELASRRGGGEPVEILLNVHSTFRTPYYNRRKRFARHSRHQYGDAADVAIDANGDGRLTRRDARIVARAVDRVEALYPDLTGGVGVYTSRRWRQPFVHIDTRGARARWRG